MVHIKIGMVTETSGKTHQTDLAYIELPDGTMCFKFFLGGKVVCPEYVRVDKTVKFSEVMNELKAVAKEGQMKIAEMVEFTGDQLFADVVHEATPLQDESGGMRMTLKGMECGHQIK